MDTELDMLLSKLSFDQKKEFLIHLMLILEGVEVPPLFSPGSEGQEDA